MRGWMGRVSPVDCQCRESRPWSSQSLVGTTWSGYRLQIGLFDFVFGVRVLNETVGLCCMGGMFIGV